MNCKETQYLLLEAHDTPSAEVQAHLAACPECRRFAAFQKALLGAPASGPSAEVDEAVQSAAGFRLAKRRRQQQRRHRWLAAAAALFVLVGWLAFVGLPAGKQPTHSIASTGKQPGKESVWADGKLEAALRGLEEQAALLTQPVSSTATPNIDVPTLDELDNDLLDLELKFYFERAVLGTVEPQANG
jgi:anti-sigma factor RsiW